MAQMERIKKWVQSQVSPKRYKHIQGVVQTGRKLATLYHLPKDKVEIACWFHDCAKELSKEVMLNWIKKSPFPLDSTEKRMPSLWHPHAGAAIALKQWGIKDRLVLEGIRCHTLGSPLMSLFAQAVFVADFIEPGRDFEGVEVVRKVAQKNLTDAVLLKCSMTIFNLLEKKIKIHPRLIATWNSFLDAKNEK